MNYLLEPNNFFVEKYPVAMASCLVDITHEVTNKVRLMNPFDHEVEIRQDTVLGEAEKVECPPVSLFVCHSSKMCLKTFVKALQ
jgi:hypothetical protein